jgi:hypothetical protein
MSELPTYKPPRNRCAVRAVDCRADAADKLRTHGGICTQQHRKMRSRVDVGGCSGPLAHPSQLTGCSRASFACCHALGALDRDHIGRDALIHDLRDGTSPLRGLRVEGGMTTSMITMAKGEKLGV